MNRVHSIRRGNTSLVEEPCENTSQAGKLKTPSPALTSSSLMNSIWYGVSGMALVTSMSTGLVSDYYLILMNCYVWFQNIVSY